MITIEDKEFNQASALLEEVYQQVYIEAYYDPTNQQLREFAKPLADKMGEVRKILRFAK
jgi:hypothetical protein